MKKGATATGPRAFLLCESSVPEQEPSVSRDSQLLHKLVQSGSADSEFESRRCDPTAMPSECSLNHFPFDILARFLQRQRWHRVQNVAQLEVFGRDPFAIGHDDCSLNAILQLPNVAWPIVSADGPQRIRRKRQSR